MFYPNPAIDNPVCVNTVMPVKKSRFEGKLKGYIGSCFKAFFAALPFGVLAGVYSAVCLPLIIIGAAFSEQTVLFLLIVALSGIPIIVLACIGSAWSIIIMLRWETKHTVISGHPVYFNAKVFSFAWTVFKWELFGILTLGIYWLWQPIRFRKWKWAHTIVDPYVQVVDVQHICQNGPIPMKKK